MRLVGRWVGAVLVSCLSVAVACGGSGVQPSGGTGSGSGSGSGTGGDDAGSVQGGADGGGPDGGGTGGLDAGTRVDAGAGVDAGTGVPDAGTDGGVVGQDAGTGGTDAGTLQTLDFPTKPGWQFFGAQNGGPQDVYDSAFDEGGNLWVAGGSEGLFLMRAANGSLSGRFEKFGIAQGLHPYGWVNGVVARSMGVPDGSPADKNPSLNSTPVISVAGGPAGTAFVGYQGKPNCESAWNWQCNLYECLQRDSAGKCVKQGGRCLEETSPSTWGDPSVYKSGDADRVTLTGSGISVAHFDIFSGPNVVSGEQGGREKVCTVNRIVWDKVKNAVWFGGNHGFAVAAADAQNTPACNGQSSCSPVWEHSHPAISGCQVEYDFATGNCPSEKTSWLTDAYFGVAVDPTSHDLWMGGSNRTTRFHSGLYNGNYDWAADDTENPPGEACRHSSSVCGIANRWDFWPDNQPEWRAPPAGAELQQGVIYLSPKMRSSTPVPDPSLPPPKPDYALDDNVSGIAAVPDGTAWLGSFAHGLIHIDSTGRILADATAKIMTRYVSTVAYDPAGSGSVWAGMQYGPGISRIDGNGNVINYSYGAPLDPNATLGDKLSNAAVASIQSAGAGAARRMTVGFHKFSMAVCPTAASCEPAAKKTINYAGAVAVYSGN